MGYVYETNKETPKETLTRMLSVDNNQLVMENLERTLLSAYAENDMKAVSHYLDVRSLLYERLKVETLLQGTNSLRK